MTPGDLASQWKKYKQILEISNRLPFKNEEDKGDIDKVLELFKNCCIGETNVIYGRYIFNRVQESVSHYHYHATIALCKKI